MAHRIRDFPVSNKSSQRPYNKATPAALAEIQPQNFFFFGSCTIAQRLVLSSWGSLLDFSSIDFKAKMRSVDPPGPLGDDSVDFPSYYLLCFTGGYCVEMQD